MIYFHVFDLRISSSQKSFLATELSSVNKKKVNFNNPFQNQLSFLGELIPEQVTIFDVNRVPVLSSTSKIIDTSQLSPGVYFLVLEIE